LTISSLWDRFSAFLSQSDFPAAPHDRRKPAALPFEVDKAPPLLEGLPLQIPGSAPSFEALQTEQGIMELSTFLIRRHTSQVKVKSRKGFTTVLIHLDH